MHNNIIYSRGVAARRVVGGGRELSNTRHYARPAVRHDHIIIIIIHRGAKWRRAVWSGERGVGIRGLTNDGPQSI